MEQLLETVDDLEGLRNLVRQVQEARPDLAAEKQESRDFFQGKNDARLRRDSEAGITRTEQRLAQARARGGATLAAAAASLVRARLYRETLGGTVDVDEVVRLAEEAHKAAPSLATVNLLELAWLARASQALSRQEPEYAAMVRAPSVPWAVPTWWPWPCGETASPDRLPSPTLTSGGRSKSSATRAASFPTTPANILGPCCGLLSPTRPPASPPP